MSGRYCAARRNCPLTWTCQFNPYNPSVSLTSVGFIYEPLEFVDALQTNSDGSNKITPWLATDSSWNSDYTVLTFTIRSGVKWSDGQPFSANDVLYTFDALKGDAAIDTNALWAADGGPLTDETIGQCRSRSRRNRFGCQKLFHRRYSR